MNQTGMTEEVLDGCELPVAQTLAVEESKALKWISLLCRIVLGGVFAYAGVTKILNPQQFGDSIATFKMLPAPAIALVMFGLPPLEVLLGVMMIAGIRTRTASLGVTLLTIVFLVGITQAIARGLQIDCGCFGSGVPSTRGAWITLGRDLLILGAAVFVFRHCATQSSGRDDVR